jgi:predicted dithiol-disulfide oxidoreductase (DUF899 family)
MSAKEIQETEKEIAELVKKLNGLRKKAEPIPVKNYSLKDQRGDTSLLELFAGRDKLIVIHNMGQGCRYCTLWADGLNGFLPHLENAASVVLLSKDAPDQQRLFANSRQWRFRMASHGGGEYIREQSTQEGEANAPGIVVYARQGDRIFKTNHAMFGPGDLYCSHWHVLSLLGLDEEGWTPQYNYWTKPSKLDDGGANVL